MVLLVRFYLEVRMFCPQENKCEKICNSKWRCVTISKSKGAERNSFAKTLYDGNKSIYELDVYFHLHALPMSSYS